MNPLYSSLDLEQKRDLDTSIDTFFDVHGNQNADWRSRSHQPVGL